MSRKPCRRYAASQEEPFSAEAFAEQDERMVWGTAHAVVHHDITVSIEPERGEIRVKDRLSIPGDLDSLSLSGAARVLSVSGASVQVHRGGHVLRPAAEARGIAELEYTLPLDEAVDEALMQARRAGDRSRPPSHGRRPGPERRSRRPDTSGRRPGRKNRSRS